MMCGDSMTCTFFGHRDTPKSIEPILKSTLTNLIEQFHVNSFYVGHNGNFDYMVKKVLENLKTIYPFIGYTIVLSYMPREKKECELMDYSNTIYPDGLETVPSKYAIIERNKWMIRQSEYVITYVTCPVGGAAKCKSLAERAQKKGFKSC